MDSADEIRQLREELERYRQRELADLRQRLAEAQRAAEHYRSEAQRNADAARQLVAEYERQLTQAKAERDALREMNASAKRFGRPAR